MRRLIALTLVAGCASAGAPPGGPERHEPPAIVSITPDSGARNVKDRTVEFQFDEVVSDPGSGALENLVLVSPRTGAPQVSWHRSRISVKPRGGFRPDMAYKVTLLPGVTDLHNNRLTEARTVVFTTGAIFPSFVIPGRVFDWNGQRVAQGAYIEANPTNDTTLVYVAASDTAGQFELGPLPSGTYRVRAIIDQNNNRILDRNERWDTVSTTVNNTINALELDVIERDSMPPIFEGVTAVDSLTLRVQFDKPLDPRLPIQPALVRLQRADSSEIQVTQVQWAAQFDQAKQTRILDSTRRADSLRTVARNDSLRAAGKEVPAAPPPNLITTPGGPRNAPPPAKPSKLPPDRAIILTLAQPVVPGSYVLGGRGFRNLVGHSADIKRAFVIPKPTPPDTTKRAVPPARRDTTRPPPATRPPPLHR